MQQSILWYDLETWHNQPETTRIAQFAAIRTDLELNPIDEPIVLYCQLASDYIPSPYAILVHGYLPSQINSQQAIDGYPVLTELELLKQIKQQFEQPGTIVSGYNNLRFDNLVLRFSWYRNAMQPYSLEHGKDSRWDIIDLVRTCYALRPEGVQWAKNEQGKISFRLEDLAKSNQLQQQHAHDAKSDVETTIALAQRIRQAQPKLYNYIFNLRSTEQLINTLKLQHHDDYLAEEAPTAPLLVHISGMLPAETRRCEIIMPITKDANNKNQIIAVGLQIDPQQWLDLDIEQLKAWAFANSETLQQQYNNQRLRLIKLRLKNCPILAPLSVLNDTHWQALATTPQQIKQYHQQLLNQLPEITAKLKQLFDYNTSALNNSEPTLDIDRGLYQGGFITSKDATKLNIFHHSDWQTKNEQHFQFQHPYLKEICLRTRARNALDTLDKQQRQQWFQHCLDNWQTGKASGYSIENALTDLETVLEKIENQENPNDQQSELLLEFGNWLEDSITQLQQNLTE